MNEFEKMRRRAQHTKEAYPPGTRILLLSMGDDPRPIEPNTRGTEDSSPNFTGESMTFGEYLREQSPEESEVMKLC